MGLGTSESERFSREYVLNRVRYTEVLLYREEGRKQTAKDDSK